MRETPTHLVLVILGEPTGSSLSTWVAFSEEPVLGGAIVMAGIAVAFVRKR